MASKFVLTNLGIRNLLLNGLGTNPNPSWLLCLSVQKFTPNYNSVWTDFIECTVPGYTRQPFIAPQFLTQDDETVWFEKDNMGTVFNPYAGPEQTVYGAFVVLGASRVVMGSQLFASPIPIPLAGKTVNIKGIYGIRQRDFAPPF